MKEMIFVLSLASCALMSNALADEYYGSGESNVFSLNARYVESSWMDGVSGHDGGALSGDETWAAASVHVVYGTVVVPTNVTLTIERGAVVKFVGGGLHVLGSCIANGVTFTDIADGVDAANASLPLPSYVLNGNIGTDGTTVVKFCREGDGFPVGGESNVFALNTRNVEGSWLEGVVVHNGGALVGNETWTADSAHVVYGTIVVSTNATLMIESGAVVKFVGGGLYVLGLCVANGVTFTDIADGTRSVCQVPSYVLNGNFETDEATRIKFAQSGDAFAQAGESGVFWLDISDDEYRFARDTEPITFSSVWANCGSVKVTVTKDGRTVGTLANENGEAEGVASWVKPSDIGFYELRHESGGEVLTAMFAVVDGIVHSGVIANDETWASGTVHIVSKDVSVVNGATLTIEPGAVVKLFDGTTLAIEAGGACVAEGVTFTGIADDTVGGDTLGDGVTSVTEHGAYAIVGDILDDENTHYRFIDRIALRVQDVVFRQRYPWNGLVDIDFTVKCGEQTNINIIVSAKDESTGKALAVRNVWLENDETHTNALVVQRGMQRLVWDAGVDNPGIVSDAVSVEVSAYVGGHPLYMVIDLSGGQDADSYPVSYLADVPQGGWTDEYKTTKLVLRWILAGAFMMGSPEDEVGRGAEFGREDFGGDINEAQASERLHQVTLTMPFYIGVFEVTQAQWLRIYGSIPPSHGSYGDTLPEDWLTYDMVRGSSQGAKWPMSSNVDASSFMGRLRARASGFLWDIPTEAQWEYACRAGTTTALNNGENLIISGDGESSWSDENMDQIGRYWCNGGEGHEIDGDGMAEVGSYLPNAWGLYDMHGNAWEWCLDWYQNDLGSLPVTDPVGPTTGSCRVRRGGSWMNPAYYCRSAYRYCDDLWDPFPSNGHYGFRLCCVAEDNISSVSGNGVVARSGSDIGRLDVCRGTYLVSGVEMIAYSPRWGSVSNCAIVADDVTVKKATEEGEYEWIPSGVGAHTLTLTAGNLVYTAQFTVLGDDVATHAGTLTTNETWSADKVHLVTADVTVANGVSLLIEPGSVVKLMPSTSLNVSDGATCTAIGVVFTHANDDTLQGDTLFDGETAPVQDDYKITGNITDDDTTEYRYMAPQELTSNVTTDLRLRGHRVYVVSSDVTVASGATLTIQPGAVLKFTSGRSLTVNSGGTLNAQGTRALPIVFTSIKDDAYGGDTNGDGDATHAESGDWARIYVSGSARMDYCTIRYCNNNSDYGAIQGRDSGSVTFDNGVIEYSVYECVRMGGGSRFEAHNSVFRESSMGFGYFGGSGTYVYNCVVADCTVGCRASSKYFYNTIFYNCKSFTDQHGDNSLFRHCLFFNTSAKIDEGFAPSYGKVGSNGNMWGDPKFERVTRCDYCIATNSPCIDAGDAAYAPKTDYFGQKRVTVYEREGDGDGGRGATALPDIGIHEVMPREVKSDVDLAVESVVAPETFVVGEKIAVAWNVKNVGSETASGTWSDKVELVCANGSAVELGTVTTSATIPADGVQTFSGTFTVPSAQVGAVRVRVTANADRDIFEGTLTANNVAESPAATLTVPELAFPDSGVASFNVAAGGSAGYRLGDGFADGGLLVVHVNGGQGAGRPTGVNVWTGNGQVPTADIFYAAAVEVGGGDYLVRVPAGGDAYVAFANSGNQSAQVEVGVERGAFLLFDTGVVTAPNAGTVTLTLFGNGFEDGMEAWIEKGGTRSSASEIVVFDPIKAVAMFDVTGLAAGEYEVCVKMGGAEDSASILALTETRLGPKWSCKLDIASAVRSSREYVGYLEYSNSGDMPLAAPYVKLTAGSGSFIRFGASDAWGDTLELMATSETYPASQLKPGETRRIPFRYKTTGSSLSIECGYTQEDATAFPWDTNAAYMRPSWASDELWGLSLAVLKSNVGATWNDYLARMRANCDHLAKIGQPTYRLDRIWQLEINEALGVDHAVSTLASNTDLARSGRGFGLALSRSYGSGLYRRLRKGIFGYGWSDNYSAYAELQNSGATLALHSGSGSTYLFEKVNGKWTPEDARDKTTCTESSSEYVLTYRSGTVQRIAKSNMRVSSVTDNQGNSLTFTYNADKQLVKVEHCDGQSLSFTYAGGLLASATDDQGRTTRYEYSGDMLVKVTAFNGLSTQYRYLPADGSVTSRALRQIAYADGTTRDFTYGADGFVATMANNGDKQMTQIAHMGVGEYSITAPNGGVSSSVVGWAGEQLQSVNALNEKTTVNYTADGLLDSLVGSTGKRAKVSYDEDGQMVKSVDAGGVETGFGSTSDYGRLSSVTDARGNVFKYGYDNKGRLISIEYADGFLARIKYSDRGVITNSVNRRGQSISYTYDREGRMLSKVWENGRTFTWAYNGKGNCTNATDSLTGTVTMEYDENERLVRIVHPKGRGFAYTYDSLGRTTSRTTLTGGSSSSATAADIQKYEYDSLGRLLRMTDGDGNLYVEKKYDETTGWLITQTYGNGTIVSNAYDILGRTIGIYHLRQSNNQTIEQSSNQILAFFEYAYDDEGRRISQTTAEGVERYTYDTVGQLADVIYPDGSEEHFTYDAVGNRMESRRPSGDTATYTANNLNQYTSAGAATLTYDLDGNLTSKTTPTDGTTFCYYDIQNRLVAVTNTTKDIAWSCEYDVFGNRTKVIDHGTAKETLFVQGSLPSAVADYDGEGTVATRHILLGSVRLADLTTNHSSLTTKYYHSDGLASTRLLTDAKGETAGMASYYAFGEIRTSSGDVASANWIGTIGVERDTTGLIFMRNRYYDVNAGRFIQFDATGLNAGHANLYIYCANDPVDHVDISGHDFHDFLSGANFVGNTLGMVAGGAAVALGAVAVVAGAVCIGAVLVASAPAIAVAATAASVAVSCGTAAATAGTWAIAGTAISVTSHAADEVLYGDGYTSDEALGDMGSIAAAHLGGNSNPIIKGGATVVGTVISANDFVGNIDEMYGDGNNGNPRINQMHNKPRSENSTSFSSEVRVSYDPNEMSGPAGVGAQRYVKPGEPMDYTIYFENQTNATAAAIKIAVTLPKDANLDWSTLELGEVVFGDHTDTGFVDDKTARSIKYALADSGCEVHTTVTETDSDITWNLRIWDPTTSDHFPDDFNKGVLPPNDPETHCGEGHIAFRVKVKEDAVPGQVIHASASIVFDDNPAIVTDPAWWNTVGSPGAAFAESEVAVSEGETAEIRINGGSAESASSVKVYLTCNTAAAADLDLTKGTIDGVTPKGGLKFPLTLTWEAGEIGEKVITIPIKVDKTVEDDEFFTLQLADAVGMELGDERVCTVTIRDANDKMLKTTVTPYKPKKGETVATNSVTVASGNAKGGFVYGTGEYTSGSKLTLTAEARPGWAFVGWRRANSEDVVSDKAKWQVVVTNDAEYVAVFEKIPYVRGLADPANAGKVAGSGLCDKGKKVTLKATANKGFVFTGWVDSQIAIDGERLQKGAVEYIATTPSLVVDRSAKPAKDTATSTTITNVTDDATYYACFITSDEDKASIDAAADGWALEPWVSKAETHAFATNIWAGVYLEWPVTASALSEAKVKVAGLPSGLKFTDKPVTSKIGTGKTAVTITNVPANTIYGAPTAASKMDKGGNPTPSAVKFTVTTAGKSTQTYQIDTVVDVLPTWAQGTFAGGWEPEDAATSGGQVSLTVDAKGKVSGKALGEGLTYTLAAPYYSAFALDENQASNFLADVTASWSYKEGSKTIKTNEVVQLVVQDNIIGGYAAVEDWFDAYTANWKVEPWKALGKSVDKQTMVYAILADGTLSDDENYDTVALGEDVAGRVSLKFAASGAVTVTGEFVTAYNDKTKKYTTIKATGSATLVPVDNEHGAVFIYLTPKGLPPHARCVDVPLPEE